MLSFEQERIIKEQLQKENAQDFVQSIILCYCKTPTEAASLLELIPKIVEKVIMSVQNKVYQYNWATLLLLAERHTFPIPERVEKSKKRYEADFPTLLYVSKAHFPNGNCDGGSVAERAFWNEFIQALVNKKGFDYNDPTDWEWIGGTDECGKWLLSVIHQNIDEGFKIPSSLKGRFKKCQKFL